MFKSLRQRVLVNRPIDLQGFHGVKLLLLAEVMVGIMGGEQR